MFPLLSVVSPEAMNFAVRMGPLPGTTDTFMQTFFDVFRFRHKRSLRRVVSYRSRYETATLARICEVTYFVARKHPTR
jgi:hypothetical protein